MKPSKKSAKQDENNTTTHLHHHYILPITLVVVSCVDSRVVEGIWEGIAGYVVHVDLHGECVMWLVDAIRSCY